MRTLIALLFVLMAAVACKNDEPKPEEVALQAAKVYYDQLLHGDYDAYVEGTLKGDSVPPAYRQQLLLNMQMYVEQQKREHKGISEVKALRAVHDSATHTVNAYLGLHYADSVREEIVVPMVEKNGVWYLR